MAYKANKDGFYGGFFRAAGSVFPAVEGTEKPSWADEVPDGEVAEQKRGPSEFRKQADASAKAQNVDPAVQVQSSTEIADAVRSGEGDPSNLQPSHPTIANEDAPQGNSDDQSGEPAGPFPVEPESEADGDTADKPKRRGRPPKPKDDGADLVG